MRRVDMNSGTDSTILSRIKNAREHRRVARTYWSSIQEDLDWLLIEFEDYESGELGDDYTSYINDCLAIYNQALSDLRKTANALHQSINDIG